jgi:hypothetical protein
MVIKAVITTLDNLPLLKEQVAILSGDPFVSEVIVVNNGSIDDTADWLAGQPRLTAINRDNLGAGPGRNAGLDAAGFFDYVLMLDGGIRPLIDGIERLSGYLEATPEADVIGLEIPDFETDERKAWRRWPQAITSDQTYANRRLSHTAYCLARWRAFEGLRFCEEGPFGWPGWGVDDDEMACQWNEAGITVHVVTGVHPYRRASGSFRRLYRESGVWPTQYGSTYEARLVWMQQNWPQYEPGLQWGEPWLTVVVQVKDIETAAKTIKLAHNLLRERRFEPPWQEYPNPYSIIAWSVDPGWLAWAEPRRLRQHQGNAIIVDGQVVRRNEHNEATWTGDFRLGKVADWREAIRPGAYLYGLVRDEDDVTQLVDRYNELHPPQPVKNPPPHRGSVWAF